MSKWYWRDGSLAVDMQKPDWEKNMRELEKKLGDSDYKRVALDEFSGYRVSTVWLGLDHNFLESAKPLIFETMVFKGSGWGELDMERYSTEAEAIKGHKKMVRKWKQKV